MVVKAFVELFVAGCLEVKDPRAAAAPQRLYRAVDDLDPSLLGPVERIVARCLKSFTSFRSLVESATAEVERELPGALQGSAQDSAALLRECGEVVDEALEYVPPTTSCSV